MALILPYPESELRIVGFSGTPVRDGAGLKPPLFFHTVTGRYFSANDPVRATYDEPEIAEYESRGLLARTDGRWERIEDGVVLYADASFVDPRSSERPKLTADKLKFDEPLGIWVNYLDRGTALRQLHRWGEVLLADAKALLRVARQAPAEARSAAMHRVVDDARRTRFCSPPPEHKVLREEAFACWAAALLLAGCPIDQLVRDASRDLPEHIVQRFQSTALRLAATAAPSPPRPHSEKLSWQPLAI